MSPVPQRGPLTTGDPALVRIAAYDEPLAETIAQCVRQAGYTTCLEMHGLKALAAVRTLHPALLILSMSLPDINAAALVTAVRDDAAATGIASPPISQLVAGNLHEAQAAGADIVLRTPLHLHDLVPLVHHFLGQRPPLGDVVA